MTRHDDISPSGSDSSDSEDDFLRLAPESARRKAGLTKATSPHGRGQASSITERNTTLLEKAARKTTFIVAGQTATQRRFEATKAALSAKSKSLALDADHHTRSIFDPPVHHDNDNDVDVNFPELAAFQFAPTDVQEMYEEGYAHALQRQWKPATEAWEKIVVLDAAHPGKAGAAILDWLLPLHAHMAIGYKKLGLLRRALTSYGRIRQAIEVVVPAPDVTSPPPPNRHDFIADALHQMSKIYHELGDMESALHCTQEANALLLEFMGSSVDSPEESARLETLHRDRKLAKMLQSVASGDCGLVDDLLSTLENYEASSVTLEHLGDFIDPATGATFVMAAAGCGHMPLLTKLCTEALRAKAHLEVQDKCGNTALAWACKFGQVLAIQFLLDQGASFQTLHKDELKTWPKSSLQALHEHLQTRKKSKKQDEAEPGGDGAFAPHALMQSLLPKQLASPPLPKNAAQKKPLYQPLVPVVVDQPSKKRPEVQNVVTSTSKGKPSHCTGQPKATTVRTTAAKTGGGFHAAPPSAAAASGSLVGRTLQAWTPDINPPGKEEGGEEADGGGEALESQGGAKKWDQFEANRRLFGVQAADFDENLYTTTRPTGSIDQEAAAVALAAEIEGSKRSVFKHVNEERGLDEEEGEGGGYDPEARYGAVLGSGAYGHGTTDKGDGFTDQGVLSRRHT
ncbi:hypothetical protein DYB38_002899 [Aphanomyces astaci]|uniref:LsmAD domain-containing protein n=1 Tax=Aphanomyces astaci TaxID=112090 RepID=A0A397DQ24_APHAT|nr:hypothetical protein DYB38_002899 [Aphanomyces astaci]RHY78254.1 hypothetical protein DYB34_000159 [Aphanomyces astaci]